MRKELRYAVEEIRTEIEQVGFDVEFSNSRFGDYFFFNLFACKLVAHVSGGSCLTLSSCVGDGERKLNVGQC